MIEKSHLRIGTRESKLARLQTDMVVASLKKHFPGIECEIHPITTGGDKVLDRPIAELGGRGVFVKELEEALLENKVDIVVHSLKDLPTEMPEGLTLACVMHREDARDVFLSEKADSFDSLPKGSTVATSSRRRAAQLLARRKDLKFVDMRGNIPTRVRKLEEGQCDAMILAAAGLLRLELRDKIKEYLPLSLVTPAVGQGVLAVECRQEDTDTMEMLQKIEDKDVRAAITAERSFLDELGSGCSVPAGGYGEILPGGELLLTGCVAALDGSEIYKDAVQGPKEKAYEMGKTLANRIKSAGAEKVLAQLRLSTPSVVSPP